MDSSTNIKLGLQSLPAHLFREAPEHTTRTQTVRWVKVASFPNKNLQLGLSVNGFWVREGLDDVCELCPDRGLVPIYPCLEIAPNLFQQELAKSLSDLGLPTDLVTTFPVSDIVEQALKSGSENWTRLSLQWVNTNAVTAAVEQALVLVAQSKDKRLSQRTRQDAKHILKVIAKAKGHGQQ